MGIVFQSTAQNNLDSKQDIIQAEDSSSSSANQEDINHKANISQNPSLDIDSESTNDSKNKDIKSSISVREKNILHANGGGEIEIAARDSAKSDSVHNSMAQESLYVNSSSNPSDIDVETEKTTDKNDQIKHSVENVENDDEEETDDIKLEPAEPMVTRRSRRQEKKKEAEKEKEIKVECNDDLDSDIMEHGKVIEHPFTGFGRRREYLDADDNMDDSISANERFEVDSVDGSELEDIESVDSGSTITRREITSAKGKAKKPHRKTSARKGSAKGGKGGKSKGAIGASSKGKSRRAIFKKSVSKAVTQHSSFDNI